MAITPMKIYMRYLLLVLLLVGCNNMKGPISSDAVRAKALGNHNVSFKSYEIPDGAFRGALWPSSNNGNFQIWLVDKKKEKFYDIPAPSGFNRYEKETTENWHFELLKTTEAKHIYAAKRKDGSKTIQLELPLKKRPYNFNVLKNVQGDELIVFMGIPETDRDKGLFGYVVIKNDE